MSVVARNGTTAYIGLPEREAAKLQDLWQRDEVGVELSVEVHAPVVVGVYPMRIARFAFEPSAPANGNGHARAYHAPVVPAASEGLDVAAPKPMPPPLAPSFGDPAREDVATE